MLAVRDRGETVLINELSGQEDGRHSPSPERVRIARVGICAWPGGYQGSGMANRASSGTARSREGRVTKRCTMRRG